LGIAKILLEAGEDEVESSKRKMDNGYILPGGAKSRGYDVYERDKPLQTQHGRCRLLLQGVSVIDKALICRNGEIDIARHEHNTA
jgi:hypothetical protein